MIHPGTQERLISEVTLGAGSTSREGVIQSDSLLATLWVNSVTSGSLSVSIYTMTEPGKEVLLFSFPVLVAPTVNLLLKKSGISLARFRVVATYTGICDYEIYIRAVEGAGESNSRIIGAGQWEVSQADVTTTPSILIPASLNDRNGILVKNWSPAEVIYIGETLAKADASVGYPLSGRDAIAIDLVAGAEIYAVAASGVVDVRIVEVGS